MTKPIDVKCPECRSEVGKLCISGKNPKKKRQMVGYFHARREKSALGGCSDENKDQHHLRLVK